MKYEYFQVNDFVTDAFFQKWVRSPDEYTDTFWEHWMMKHPEKKESIRQARVLLKSLEAQRVPYHEEDFYSVKQNIKSQLFGDQQPNAKEREMISKNSKIPWLKLAAAVSGIIVLSICLLQNWLPKKENFSTGNGEQMEVKLPDGSRAMLNANSSLKVSADWEEDREVWLKGEVFFEVEKVKGEGSNKGEVGEFRKFTVHAREVEIEVLGTSFNVLDRRDVTMVVLEEGLVALRQKQVAEETIRMHPGELVSYSNQDKSFKKEKANTRTALGWKNGKHIFEATPLKAIAKVLEDNYGLKVIIESHELGGRRFSANVPYGELDLLLRLISESMQVEVTKEEGVISIRKSS